MQRTKKVTGREYTDTCSIGCTTMLYIKKSLQLLLPGQDTNCMLAGHYSGGGSSVVSALATRVRNFHLILKKVVKYNHWGYGITGY